MNGAAGNGLYAARHFQNAYVTRDVEAAADMFGERHGITAFEHRRDLPVGPDAAIHLALAWAGDVMIELIQPVGPALNMYTSWLPEEGQLLRFHHLGHLLPDEAAWHRIVSAADRSGLPVALQGESQGVHYLYLDARSELGHYLEYVHLSGAGVHLFDKVPRN